MTEYSTTDIVAIVGISRQAIQKQLKNVPHKKLSGRGGEFTYRFDDLPDIIQEKIVYHEQENQNHLDPASDILDRDNAGNNKRNKTGSTARSIAHGSKVYANAFSDSKAEERAEQRVRAWLKIFNLQEEYCYEHNISKVVDRDSRFSEAYNSGEIQVPGWVRTSIPSLSRSNLARIRFEYKKKKQNALRGNYGNRKGATKLTVEMQDLIIRLIPYRVALKM